MDEGEVHILFMSDEAHFHLSGFVNKQNFRYWAKNSYQLRQKPLHSAKFRVWRAISSFGIIGPYFFEDNNETATTVSSARYVHRIQTFPTQYLTQFPQVNDDTCFQQDKTSHAARN
jgi:hypothetical protein